MTEEERIRKEVLKYIKDYLKESGVKQGFLAEKIGYTDKTFSAKLNGYVKIELDDIVKICKYFGENVSRFIKDDEAG